MGESRELFFRVEERIIFLFVIDNLFFGKFKFNYIGVKLELVWNLFFLS